VLSNVISANSLACLLTDGKGPFVRLAEIPIVPHNLQLAPSFHFRVRAIAVPIETTVHIRGAEFTTTPPEPGFNRVGAPGNGGRDGDLPADAIVVALVRYAIGHDLVNVAIGGHYGGEDEAEYMGTHGKVGRVWCGADKWWRSGVSYNALRSAFPFLLYTQLPPLCPSVPIFSSVTSRANTYEPNAKAPIPV